jgi:hypothetical protein
MANTPELQRPTCAIDMHQLYVARIERAREDGEHTLAEELLKLQEIFHYYVDEVVKEELRWHNTMSDHRFETVDEARRRLLFNELDVDMLRDRIALMVDKARIKIRQQAIFDRLQQEHLDDPLVVIDPKHRASTN